MTGKRLRNRHRPVTTEQGFSLAEREALASIWADQFVYALRLGAADGPIKIGLSADPASRAGQLQTASPYPIEFLGCIVGDQGTESALHDRFRAHHLHGEWFKPAPAILSWCQGELRSVEFWVEQWQVALERYRAERRAPVVCNCPSCRRSDGRSRRRKRRWPA